MFKKLIRRNELLELLIFRLLFYIKDFLNKTMESKYIKIFKAFFTKERIYEIILNSTK